MIGLYGRKTFVIVDSYWSGEFRVNAGVHLSGELRVNAGVHWSGEFRVNAGVHLSGELRVDAGVHWSGEFRVNAGVHLSGELRVNAGVHWGTILSTLLFSVVDPVSYFAKNVLSKVLCNVYDFVLISKTTQPSLVVGDGT